jgi:predicted HicB family RNase H-like nuclease
MTEKTIVIAVRVKESIYDRLKIRAIKNKVSVGAYLKNWIEKELNR